MDLTLLRGTDKVKQKGQKPKKGETNMTFNFLKRRNFLFASKELLGLKYTHYVTSDSWPLTPSSEDLIKMVIEVRFSREKSTHKENFLMKFSLIF